MLLERPVDETGLAVNWEETVCLEVEKNCTTEEEEEEQEEENRKLQHHKI